jgi:hypothetical protein
MSAKKGNDIVRANPTGPFCLARLTNWERTNECIGDSTRRASMISLCPNKPEKGLPICVHCLERPDSSKYQTRMIHGLLTEEPPPESHIYGSEWYWKQVEKYGDPPKEWIDAAELAQRRAEERAGEGAWRWLERGTIQSNTEETEEMPPRKKTIESTPQKTTLLINFPLITQIYQESTKNPKQMPTDSMKIVKKGDVWETEDGLRFKVDARGDIGDMIL